VSDALSFMHLLHRHICVCADTQAGLKK